MSKTFKVNSVDLSGKNLIEASAGTGKTYSIGILTLRLIIEKDIPVNEILMVTFTNAAVAELEDRIRKFIRAAYKISKGEKVNADYAGIVILLDEIIDENKATKDEIACRLEAAIQLLDETSIQTIHSFCQETLTEYAFETDQMYGAELFTNVDDVILDSVQDFWRKHITNINVEFLGMINIKMSNLISVVQNSLADKVFIGKKVRGVKDICELYQAQLTIKQDFLTHFENKDWNNYLDGCLSISGVGQGTVNKWKEYALDAENFWEKLKDNKTNRLFLEEEVNFKNNYNNNITRSVNTIYHKVIELSSNRVNKHLFENKLMTHDDLITNVHKAVAIKKNTKLIASLKDKYQAVFIDEFQDTDKNQYDIFDTVFGGGEDDSILFYIGDPKQSIYAWRKADINTYFSAKNGCKTRIMNVNYRSSKNYVDAMNEFFQAPDDPFCFKDNKAKGNTIDYEVITANKKRSSLIVNNEEIKPITIYKDAEDISIKTADGILQLLNNGQLNGEKINPSNIAVLVRKKAQGKEVKLALESFGVPAITLDDSRVFESEEAKNIGYILETVIDLSWKGINKALLNDFTGKSAHDLLKLNKKSEVNNFRNYQEIWTNNGVYTMLLQYISDYNVQAGLASVSGGERIISNFYQIAEILQKQEVENKYSKTEVYRFLRRNIEGFDNQNEEYLQQIESDEQAVKIVTIHKSKGLEYDIVFAPFLDFTLTNRWTFLDYRAKNNDYVFTLKSQMNNDENAIWRLQNEQENRRLIYVAITRAKYNCFLFKKEEVVNEPTSLSPFFVKLTEKSTSIKDIEIKEFDWEMDKNEKFSQVKKKSTKVPLEIPKNLKLKDRHWRKMSYSYLSGDHGYSAKELKVDSYDEGSYNQFIFKDLPKGAHVGNLLHNIFEFIDFTEKDSSKWINTIEVSLKRFLPNPAYKDVFIPQLLRMTQGVLNTEIKVGEEQFKLSNIPNSNKITELEFDFMIDNFNVDSLSTLEKYLPRGFHISTKQNEKIEGILHGFIDLFFECNGKYYILDWKSNFLGDTVDDYNNDKLINAMSENNYHLQYIIYTLAIKKYLSSKTVDFDYNKHFGGVIYLFLRGVRENEKTGVFTYKPVIEIIDTLDNILIN